MSSQGVMVRREDSTCWSLVVSVAHGSGNLLRGRHAPEFLQVVTSEVTGENARGVILLIVDGTCQRLSPYGLTPDLLT